jgi:hypothetical protein
MEYKKNGSRYLNYCMWEDVKDSNYDYSRNGLLKYLMSKRITQSNNPMLQNVLWFLEQSLVHLMQCVDELKHFKNYHWKNR